MIVSLAYVLVCCLFAFVVLLARGDRSKEIEILVLRHELLVLRRQVRMPQFTPRDRLILAALSRVLPRRSWQAFLVRPETLLRWQRRLVSTHWTLKGAQIRFYAARLYSWMRPPSRSRRSTAAVGRGRARSLRAEGSGGLRFSERWGRWLL